MIIILFGNWSFVRAMREDRRQITCLNLFRYALVVCLLIQPLLTHNVD